MEYPQWNDSFNVGVEAFYKDHRQLVKLVNDLHTGLVPGFGISEMSFILDDLVRYTVVHFKREHRALTEQVLEFQSQLREGKRHSRLN